MYGIAIHRRKFWQILIWRWKGIPPNRQNFRLYIIMVFQIKYTCRSMIKRVAYFLLRVYKLDRREDIEDSHCYCVPETL